MPRKKDADISSEQALRHSETRYQALFEHCPIGLMEEDLSNVKKYLDKMRKEGVADFRSYFIDNPQVLEKCAALVQITSVNRSAMVDFNASSLDEYSSIFSHSLNGVALERFGEELAAFMEGQTFVKFTSFLTTPEGRQIDVEIRASVAPGSEDTLDKVFVSVVDVCDLQDKIRLQERVTKEVLETIGKITEIHDPYTSGHQRRVGLLAEAIGRDLDLPDDKVRALKVAGTVHDLGKLYVPTQILSKPAELTEIEMSIVRTHPETGRKFLSEIEFSWPIAEIVDQHHERLDGSGYPNAIKGDDIMMEAKIIAVADVVEAMSQYRPYREQYGFKSAFDEIEHNKNVLYDSAAVDSCRRLFEESHFRFT